MIGLVLDRTVNPAGESIVSRDELVALLRAAGRHAWASVVATWADSSAAPAVVLGAGGAMSFGRVGRGVR